MIKRKIGVFICVLVLCAGTLACILHSHVLTPQQQYEKGIALINQDDVFATLYPSQFREGTELIRKAARKNYAPAQFILGLLYLSEEYGMQNLQEASRWFHRAASQGHRDACHNLGKMYYEGKGVVRDVPEAIRWMTTAAHMGEIEDVIILALLYIDGDDGVPADLENSSKWFTVANLMGFPVSETPLGTFQKKTEKISRTALKRAKTNAIEFYRQMTPSPW